MGKMLRLTQEQYDERQARIRAAINGEPVDRQSSNELSRQVQELGPSLTPKPKRRKYLNQPQYFDRIKFDSKAELAEYKRLRLREYAGEIRDLVVHPVFWLHADGGDQIGRYVADFRFIDVSGLTFGAESVREVVSDVKSKRTAATAQFRRTLRHMQVEYGITVQVVLA